LGVQLDLYVNDESIESPWLSRSFLDEIIFEYYIQFNDFLTESEQKAIYPNPDGEITIEKKNELTEKDKAEIIGKLADTVTKEGSITNVSNMLDQFVIKSEELKDRKRDPKFLKVALEKVQKELIKNSDSLPVVHSIFVDKQLTQELGTIEVNGIKAHIEGDLYWLDNYPSIKNKIRLKSYLEDFGKVDIYVDVYPEMEIEGKTLYSKTINKAEQFAKEFNRCYQFLDEAIGGGKKILWEFG
jgi:hypothetical protein